MAPQTRITPHAGFARRQSSNSLAHIMGRHNNEQPAPDLFPGERVSNRSADIPAGGTVVRRPRQLVLPTNLSKSIKYLDDRELDRLLVAAIDEAKRRGRPQTSHAPGRTRMGIGSDEANPKRSRSTSLSRHSKIGPASAPLTQGRINAVRAAFRAGITPARIARQFGLSQADVRTALSSDE